MYELFCLALLYVLVVPIEHRAPAACMFVLRQRLPMRSWATKLRLPALADRNSTGHLLPVAIELWHADGSPGGKTAVYTPANSHEKARVLTACVCKQCWFEKCTWQGQSDDSMTT